jgi:methionyl-tRNA formyltransferase
MRCIFLGSPPFAMPVFEALLDCGHVVLALVTRPDRPRGRGREIVASELVELARSRDIPVLQPETTRSPEFVESLRALEPDVLMVASYGEILRQDVLDLAPFGALNVHGSLLPRWRGAAPIQRAVAAGDRETGVSVQRMVLALDEGDLLLERRTPIGPEDTAGTLFDRLASLGGEAAVEALDRLESGEATFTPQDTELVTHAPKLVKADGDVDWSRSAVELERHVRAMHPWPGARSTTPDGKALVIVRARVAEADEESRAAGAPGELLEAAPRCLVAAGEGSLELLEVKPSGKRAMAADAWLRGARLKPGTRLGTSGAQG